MNESEVLKITKELEYLLADWESGYVSSVRLLVQRLRAAVEYGQIVESKTHVTCTHAEWQVQVRRYLRLRPDVTPEQLAKRLNCTVETITACLEVS